jgi:hypothetical protein
MKEVLIAHASILKEIPLLIADRYKIQSDKIKLVNISTLSEGMMTFQLAFYYPDSDPMKEVALNFELKDSSPHMLYFETLTGLKGYEKTNEYHGLNNEIVKYISTKADL